MTKYRIPRWISLLKTRSSLVHMLTHSPHCYFFFNIAFLLLWASYLVLARRDIVVKTCLPLFYSKLKKFIVFLTYIDEISFRSILLLYRDLTSNSKWQSSLKENSNLHVFRIILTTALKRTTCNSQSFLINKVLTNTLNFILTNKEPQFWSNQWGLRIATSQTNQIQGD